MVSLFLFLPPPLPTFCLLLFSIFLTSASSICRRRVVLRICPLASAVSQPVSFPQFQFVCIYYAFNHLTRPRLGTNHQQQMKCALMCALVVSAKHGGGSKRARTIARSLAPERHRINHLFLMPLQRPLPPVSTCHH